MFTENSYLHLKYNGWKYGMLSFILTTIAIVIMLVTKSTTGITIGKIILLIEGMALIAYNLVYKDLKRRYGKGNVISSNESH